MEHEPLDKYKYKHKLDDLMSGPPAEYKKICCPSCNADIPAENININDKIAKCNECHVVFPIHSMISNFTDPKKIKQEVLRPEGIDIFYFQDDLDFTVQQPLVVTEVLAAIFLPLFDVLAMLLYFKVGISLFWPASLFLLFTYMIFSLANRSKHKIHINIDDRYLTIKWRPKKLMKDRSFPINEIDQIYAKSSPGIIGAVYMVINGADGQKHVPLISGLDSLSKARYLEQEIERHLGIDDRHIPEETKQR